MNFTYIINYINILIHFPILNGITVYDSCFSYKVDGAVHQREWGRNNLINFKSCLVKEQYFLVI